MSNLRSSRPEDSPRLRQLWKTAFGDEEEYLDLFFGAAYVPECSMVLEERGRILGAAYWLDCELTGRRLAYIYAVAITPARQGQGLGSQLMDAIHNRLILEGYCAAILVPGSQGLFEYYRRFGYRTGAYHREFTAAAETPAVLSPIGVSRYAQLRRQYLPENGLIQEGENLALLASLARFYEGPNCVCAIAKDTPTCLELLGSEGAAGQLTAALGFSQCKFRIPGIDKPYAMVKHLSGPPLPQQLYLGFGFD